MSANTQPTWRRRWEDQYASGHTPWDTQITPPEVEAFWSSGRLAGDGLAFDIGCGPGTNVLYLARKGLVAIGFDIALHPLLTGRERIDRRAPEVAARAHFVQADVTCLPLTGAGAAYILDVGCFHGVRYAERDSYVAGIVANLHPGGYYQLYAFDRTPEMAADPDRKLMGVEEDEIAQRFAPQCTIIEIIRARPDRYPCRWYLLQRV